MAEVIRVLIADDHLHERIGLRRLLELVEGIAVIGEAISAQEAVQMALAQRPDVVLMDLRWYGDDEAGTRAIRQIKAEAPDVRVLATTNFPEKLREAADRAGADVVVAKDFLVSPEAIETHIRAALTAAPPPPNDEPLPERLTEREMDVLRMIAQDKTNQQIARELSLAVGTVKKYVAAIQSKLGAESRYGAVAKAYEYGILRRGDAKGT